MQTDINQNPKRVADELAEDQQDVNQNLAFRMSNAPLSALRAQNPFLAILPFANTAIGLILPANTPTDVNLPRGTKFIYISGSDEYYISRNGQAQIPTEVNTNNGTASRNGSYQNPEGFFIYVEEMEQFSIVAVNANTRISIACYLQM
jgi:hypothetical protein